MMMAREPSTKMMSVVVSLTRLCPHSYVGDKTLGIRVKL